jgi:hypothetical protein
VRGGSGAESATTVDRSDRDSAVESD